MRVAELRHRLTFQARPIQTGDEYGTYEGDFEDEFTVWAAVKPKLGGEDVLAGRLKGRNLVNITIRYSDQASLITTDWRAVQRIGDRITKLYNLRSIIDPDGKRMWIELLAEDGALT
jgi:SPP1 family predicted phage head-tail adaptor